MECNKWKFILKVVRLFFLDFFLSLSFFYELLHISILRQKFQCTLNSNGVLKISCALSEWKLQFKE